VLDEELTVAGLLARRAGDEHVGLLAGDDSWTWDEVVGESATRAALLNALRVDGPPHVGVLLDNTPEFLFWIGGAALAGATIVGINPTRRGAELASDIRHTDCQLVVTDAAGKATFDGLDIGVPDDRILDIGSTEYKQLVLNADEKRANSEPVPAAGVGEDSLLLLLFTSGTTGAPKAVRCTQGRLASIAQRVEDQYGLNRDDVCYAVMPLFHGNALMALWAPALRTGATVALAPKFSASGFLADVRRYQATYFTYVGKALTYVLATPEQPDDADNTLQRGFGNEASDVDIERFQERFGCRIIEGYGSSEGGAVIYRVPDMPAGSLGVGMTPSVMVVNPETSEECPPAEFACSTPKRPPARSSTPKASTASRATTATTTPTPSAPATVGTGAATSRTATTRASSGSRAAAPTGCASTARTSPPRRSSASWRDSKV
jgi:fatty-acyl-CoA synthase